MDDGRARDGGRPAVDAGRHLLETLDGRLGPTDHPSVKVRPDGVADDRHLYPIEHPGRGSEAVAIAASLGARREDLDGWREHADAAEMVLVGWDGARYKLYLVRDEGFGSIGDPGLVHLALRWRIGDGAVSVTRYERPDGAPTAAEVVRAAFGAQWSAPATVLAATELVAAADGDGATQRCLRSVDPGGGRAGFDLLVRGAGLDLAGAAERAAAAATGLGLAGGLATLADHPRSGDPVQRLAGGLDHDGAPFLTFYLRPPRPVTARATGERRR